MHRRPHRRSRNASLLRKGFTLTELLVAILIVAALASITTLAVQGVKKSAQTAKEMSGGRNLVTALNLHAADSNGAILPGFDGSKSSMNIADAGYSSSVISGATAHRYPWRLAPYFGYAFDTTTALDHSFKKHTKTGDTYMISLMPSLGMNVYGVGGYIEEGSRAGTAPNPGALLRMEASYDPSRLIAFVSTRTLDTRGEGGGIYPGFHMATPRLMPGGDWSGQYDPENPTSWGNVDMRHKNKALVCYVDGSSELLGAEKLRDMRLWSNEAAVANDPDLRFRRATTGGRR